MSQCIFFVALSASARHIHFLLRGGRSARLIVYRFLGLYLRDGSALRTAKGALRCSAVGSRLAVAGFVSAGGSRLVVAGLVSAGVDIAVARATSVAGIVFVFVVTDIIKFSF